MESTETPQSNLPDSPFVQRMKLQLAKERGGEESPWRWEPVPFREFAASPEHMNFPYLTPRQLEMCDALLNADPKKTFSLPEKIYDLSVCLWGKGCVSGDTELVDVFTGATFTVENLMLNKKTIPIATVDEEGKPSFGFTSVPWVKGHEMLYLVTTRSGKKIKVTKGHKFLSKKGWCPLSSINIGDEILDDAMSLEHREAIRATWTPERKRKASERQRGENNTFLRKNPNGFKNLTEEQRKSKFGSQKETHPLWGTHQSVESKKKNSASNRKSQLLRWENATDEERKLHGDLTRGMNNGMWGKSPPKGAGRCCYTKYNSSSAGSVWLQGSFELRYAQHLDSLGIRWERNKDRFVWDADGHTYCPDFKVWVGDRFEYHETKGWVNEESIKKFYSVINAGHVIRMVTKDVLRRLDKRKKSVLVWDSVVSVTEVGVQQFYDLEVLPHHNYLAQGLYHHNSGKDTCASLITCYLVHILLCLKNPYHFLTGFYIDDASLDIINVAYNYEQASAVYFTMFRNRVKRWKWLRSKFRLRASGKDLDPKDNAKEFLEDKSDNMVTIYPSSIMFPNMIRAFSRHSMAQGTEGMNVISWTMDEAAAMETGSDREKANADSLYDMLRTSAQSRFANKWFGFILSFPRHKNDFIMRKYSDVINGKLPRAFASKGATWEIIPSKTYEQFRDEFENPATKQDAETKYACNPPAQQAGFIEYVDKVKDCISLSRLQIVEFEKTYKTLSADAKLVGKTIHRYTIPRQPDTKKFAARVDLGHTNDRCALCIGHLEGNNHVVIDLLTHWQAEPNCPIDIDDPAELLLKIKKELCNIYYVSYDQWQSISSLNRLNRAGIVSNKLSLGLEEYKLFRSCLYSRTIDLLDYPLLTDPSTGELVNLQLIDGNKVDHPRNGPNPHNDLSEAVVGVTAMLLGVKKNIKDTKDTSEFYAGNENSEDMSIWSKNEESADPFDTMGIQGVSVSLR